MNDRSSVPDRPPASPEDPAGAAGPLRTDTRIVTPEAVALEVDVAGLGSRMLGGFIDLSIQLAIIGVVYLISAQAVQGSTFAAVIGFVVIPFLVLWGYYPLLEGLWNGQTIGKRANHIRVVRTDGQPVTIGPVLVRNLIRIPEEFMFPFVAVVSMIVSTRAQRLGDLAGGTIVIRERALSAPDILRPANQPTFGTGADTSGIGDREYEVVRAFLQRRTTLTPEARVALASQLASQLRPRVTGPAFPPGDDEGFLELLASSFRARFAAPTPPSTPPPPTQTG